MINQQKDLRSPVRDCGDLFLAFTRRSLAAGLLRQQIGHAVQADADGGKVVEERRDGGWKYAEDAHQDQEGIEGQDPGVVSVEPFHQAVADLLQEHKRSEIILGDRDVGDLPGDGGSAVDGDAAVRL